MRDQPIFTGTSNLSVISGIYSKLVSGESVTNPFNLVHVICFNKDWMSSLENKRLEVDGIFMCPNLIDEIGKTQQTEVNVPVKKNCISEIDAILTTYSTDLTYSLTLTLTLTLLFGGPLTTPAAGLAQRVGLRLRLGLGLGLGFRNPNPSVHKTADASWSWHPTTPSNVANFSVNENLASFSDNY